MCNLSILDSVINDFGYRLVVMATNDTCSHNSSIGYYVNCQTSVLQNLLHFDPTTPKPPLQLVVDH